MAMLFFPKRADLVIFGLYFFGVLMAMVFGLMLKKTMFKAQPGNFVMELPPYHFPTFNGIMLHTWHRLKDFVLRAGKTILIVILLMNLLQVITLPSTSSPDGRISVLELAGRGLTPLLAPMGIKGENWQAGVPWCLVSLPRKPLWAPCRDSIRVLAQRRLPKRPW